MRRFETNSYPPASRSKSLPCSRDRFLQPQRPKQQILQRQQRKENRITQIRRTRHDRRHHGIHPVMVRRSHNGNQDHTRIPKSNENVEEFSPQALLDFALFHSFAEYARVIEHGAADDERVAKMHGWHGGERVHKVTTHPDGGCFVVADGVEEAVFWWKKAGRHARV